MGTGELDELVGQRPRRHVPARGVEREARDEHRRQRAPSDRRSPARHHPPRETSTSHPPRETSTSP
ncbi:hypothetical protein [Georgenia sp. SUBG003]|uniref:hypothetical protein n=1 Tax=Georgenia sp. SUBG003 TaxID=1497974 RepID=UPI003AB8034F